MKKVLALTILFVMIFSVAAYSATKAPAPSKSPASAIDVSLPFKAPAGDADLKALPPNLLENYSNYPGEVSKSPLANFKAKPKPWSVYFCNSNVGSVWRKDALDTLQKEIDIYQKAGYISKFVATSAENDVATQIQQIQTAVEQKADLIILTPLSPTAENAAIKQAYDAGIVVVTIASAATSPYAIATFPNQFLNGVRMATGLVKALNGKGNILIVNGVTGVSSNKDVNDGFMAILNKNPGIKIAGQVDGKWAPSVAKTAVIQFLATHPAKIDAVLQQGSMFPGILEAFQQAGRPIVPINIAEPVEMELAYTHDNFNNPNWKIYGTANPPAPQVDAAFRIGVLTLLGYGPKVNTFLLAPPMIDRSNFSDWWNDSYKIDSMAFGKYPPNIKLFSEKMLDAFFTKKPVLPVPTVLSGK